ncbi:MAG: AAA family ATPase [Chloroflexi bacterium]|nr:AAA family ATPase [Chloroflexota bacterium]
MNLIRNRNAAPAPSEVAPAAVPGDWATATMPAGDGPPAEVPMPPAGWTPEAGAPPQAWDGPVPAWPPAAMPGYGPGPMPPIGPDGYPVPGYVPGPEAGYPDAGYPGAGYDEYAPIAEAPLPAQDIDWTVPGATGNTIPRSATQVLTTLAGKVAQGDVDQYQPVPLGFTPLDKTIGGGLRAGELLLIGGAQGTGKTTMSVQMARNIVMGGQASVLYVCYEHDEEYLLNRIIAMESALSSLPGRIQGIKLQDVRNEILSTWLAQGGDGYADLMANPRLRPALERLARYGPNLFLLRGSQTKNTVENLDHLIKRYKELSGDRRLVVFIDYMQKVPVIPEPPSETEKVTYVVNGLKDVALQNDCPMISIVAADKDGLKASRLRNHHLRGSSAINYEADIILILNEKYQIVAKVNIEFNPHHAQRFRDWVVASVEKNRGGQNAVDLEFEKHFEFSCFDPNGRTVQEKLIEERLYND